MYQSSSKCFWIFQPFSSGFSCNRYFFKNLHFCIWLWNFLKIIQTLHKNFHHTGYFLSWSKTFFYVIFSSSWYKNQVDTKIMMAAFKLLLYEFLLMLNPCFWQNKHTIFKIKLFSLDWLLHLSPCFHKLIITRKTWPGPILAISCISIRVTRKNVPLKNENKVPFLFLGDASFIIKKLPDD